MLSSCPEWTNGTCRLTQVCDKQTATSAECCSMPRQWTGTDSACRLTLPRFARPGTAQAWHDSPPVSAQCTAKCCSTEQTSASHSRTSLVISDYAHTITTWMYHVTTNSAHSVVGHSLSPDPPSVSHFQMSSRDPRCTNKTFRQSLKTFMFRQY